MQSVDFGGNFQQGQGSRNDSWKVKYWYSDKAETYLTHKTQMLTKHHQEALTLKNCLLRTLTNRMGRKLNRYSFAETS